jgi:hypothetical protein
MGHMVPIPATYGDEMYETSWLAKSWRAMGNPYTLQRFENTYNLKLHFKNAALSHAEFPTEEAAIMFLLRWA